MSPERRRHGRTKVPKEQLRLSLPPMELLPITTSHPTFLQEKHAIKPPTHIILPKTRITVPQKTRTGYGWVTTEHEVFVRRLGEGRKFGGYPAFVATSSFKGDMFLTEFDKHQETTIGQGTQLGCPLDHAKRLSQHRQKQPIKLLAS